MEDWTEGDYKIHTTTDPKADHHGLIFNATCGAPIGVILYLPEESPSAHSQ